MKKFIIIVSALLALNAGQQAFSQASVSVGVDYNTFYTALSPYGRWVDYPTYGHIWICNEPGFRPYYNDGHWEYTADGWTWVSDYPWGWAPFHYGRWAYIDDYGWSWVPGYDWAPAWVSWCDGGDYYGWAPLGPGLGLDISISTIPADRWCFVPHQYINSPAIHNYYVDHSRNADIYRNVTVINNVHSAHNVRYIAGPRRADVERVTHTTIRARVISNTSRPGRTTVRNNTVSIYRPTVRRAATTNTTVRNNGNRPVAHTNNTTRVNRTHVTQNNQPAATHPQQRQVHRRINTPAQQHNTPTPQRQVHQRVSAPAQQHTTPQPQRQMQVHQNTPAMQSHDHSPAPSGGGMPGGRRR